MVQFGWLGAGPVPADLDLRRLGWELVDVGSAPSGSPTPCLTTDIAAAMRLRNRTQRAALVLADVADSAARAHWLALGFGDVLPPGVRLAELGQRLRRVLEALVALPRHRGHGALRLDLLTREGHVGDRRLGLHPREFALLWRLAESPGQPVSADALLSQVWQLNFRPETNSLAVHVCRLRAKLAVAGLPQIIRTDPDGAYVLAASHYPEATGPAAFAGATALDEPVCAVALRPAVEAKV